MASLNKVILIGYMTATPELKQTQTETFVTSFSIGIARKFTKQGEQPQSDFPNIVAWRGTAEFICKHFKKGDAIGLCGSIQTRTYTDKEGNKRFITEINAEEAFFVEKKTDSAPKTPAFTAETKPNFEEIADNEDLPF